MTNEPGDKCCGQIAICASTECDEYRRIMAELKSGCYPSPSNEPLEPELLPPYFVTYWKGGKKPS